MVDYIRELRWDPWRDRMVEVLVPVVVSEDSRARVVQSAAKAMMYAAPGACEYCDRRRKASAEGMRRRRERQG